MVKVIRTGNSLAVTIPSDFARSVGIRAGDDVKLRLDESKGKIIYFFSGAKQLPLSENILKLTRN